MEFNVLEELPEQQILELIYDAQPEVAQFPYKTDSYLLTRLPTDVSVKTLLKIPIFNELTSLTTLRALHDANPKT